MSPRLQTDSRRRHLAVGLALLVLLSGCSAVFGPVLKPIPDRPDTLTADSAVDYAKTFERRYVRNQVATGRENVNAIEVAYERAELQRRVDDGYVVHLEYVLRVDAGGQTTTERYTANYFVNGTVTMRARTTGFVRPGPDPREGQVMARD